MPPQAYALVTLFILCSAALGWLAAALATALAQAGVMRIARRGG